MKDTAEFLERIENIEIDQVTYLCTLDIKSLYTNVPHTEGTEAALEKLKEDKCLTNVKISLIMSLLEEVLTKNYFKFGSKYYLQIQGVSMGSPVAPSFANIFMSAFESQHIHHCPHAEDIVIWLRYVDDVFMLWKGTHEHLIEFMTGLNSKHDLIEFTLNANRDKIEYLDVEIYR